MDHFERKPRENHPREKANIFSIITFLYTLKLFKKGTKQELEEGDLYEILPDYSSKTLGDQFEAEWTKRPSILHQILACFGKEFFLLGMLQLVVQSAMIILQPHALSKIVAYFTPNQVEMTKQEFHFWVAALILANVFECVYFHNYCFAVAALGIRVRAAFCSFIYRKALKLGPSSLSDISVGKLVTLITKDVYCLESFSFYANDLWVAVAKAAVVCYIIYRKIKLAAFAGIGFYLLVLPFQIYIGSWAARLRTKMCEKVDKRLQVTQETLSAIKIIKMYTWEKFFSNKILEARKKEIRSMHLIFYLKFILLEIGALSGSIAFYLLLMTYIWLGNSITAETVYYIDSCFQILTHSLCLTFPSAVAQVAEVTASVRRLGNVLRAPELKPQENLVVSQPEIILKHVSATFKHKQILDSVNLNLDRGVVLITGPCGSGKSFLLKTILKEYLPSTGTVVTQGRVSYASQEPWLFPSTIKQNILFGEEFHEARYRKVLQVCALIYDLKLLPAGDNTIVEDRGNNLSKGQQARINLARAVYKNSEIYLLDDCLSALDSQVSDFVFKECIIKFLQNKLVLFVSHDTSHVSEVSSVVVMRRGAVISHVKSAAAPEETKNMTEDAEEEPECDLVEDGEETKLLNATTHQQKVYLEIKKEGGLDFAVYKKYLRFAGGALALAFVLVLYGTAQFVQTYAEKLVSEWVNLEEKLSNSTRDNGDIADSRDYILKLYTGMTVLSSALHLGRFFGLYSVIRRASLNLHQYMLLRIVNAKMQFFDANFLGNILNRFSKDLTTIDEYLPFIYNQVFRTIFVIAGVVVLIATVNTFFLVPTFLFSMVLILIRRYYLKTARSLKRIDAATKSPIVGQLNATLEGLTTIRALKAQNILQNEYNQHLDLYTSASYNYTSCMRAFAFCLETLCTVFIATVVGRFVFDSNGFLPGHVGLAISQALRMTANMQWGVRIWADMENSMTSVERVLEYTEVTQENKQGQVLKNWPQNEEIKYDNVCLAYTDSAILKNVSFVAHSGEKIGIVGRTGAGKSSIIATLFRLYDVQGKITIDGVDIKLLSLDFLRGRFSIIPQDPVLFTGTVRHNIDPEGQYTDPEIWKAIEAAHLNEQIPSLELEIAENGSNFSVGHRQLFCLARAIVRNNKIIVLDEATANMDPETDALIQATIQKCFGDCTVFTIAHKLHSIVNSDKIIVLDKGAIVEYGHPTELLRNQDGYFFKLAKKFLETKG